MAMSAKRLLELVAASGEVMSALDRVTVEDPRPPKIHPYEQGNPLRGTLVMGDDGTPEDPGAPGRTLGDLVREFMESSRG